MVGVNGCIRTGWIAVVATAAVGGKTGRDNRHKTAADGDSFVCDHATVSFLGCCLQTPGKKDKQAYGYWCCGG